MAKILVIGGKGFLGKNLVPLFSTIKHTVTVLSRRNGLDLTRNEDIARQLKRIKPDVIYNLAAHVGSVHYVASHAATVMVDNATMALNLYRAVTKACPEATVVNPLSNCSYPGDANTQKEEEWFGGDVHTSVYASGHSKRFLSILSWCYATQFKIKTVNFLIPNMFGPGDYTDPAKTHALNGMIIRMIEAKRKKKPTFEVWGTGKPIREWGYVKDVAKILSLIDDGKKFDFNVVNIGQNKGYSIRESAKLIRKAVGYKGSLVFNTSYQDGAPRKVLDNTLFRKLFADFIFTDHRKAIEETVEYFGKVLQ